MNYDPAKIGYAIPQEEPRVVQGYLQKRGWKVAGHLDPGRIVCCENNRSCLYPTAAQNACL